MPRLVRLDKTAHTTLAEWAADDRVAAASAATALKEELDRGFFAVVSRGEGHAEQVFDLPADADLVVLRRPIAGG